MPVFLSANIFSHHLKYVYAGWAYIISESRGPRVVTTAMLPRLKQNKPQIVLYLFCHIFNAGALWGF